MCCSYLEPLGHFGEDEGVRAAFPETLTGEFVNRELEVIALRGKGAKVAL